MNVPSSGNEALGSFQGTISGSGYGFVYLMSYPASDKVKIGHSHDPIIRATQIGGTLAPDEPVVEAYFWCTERREEVERRAHKIVAAHRHKGEWFSLSVEQAYEAITAAARDIGVALQLVFDRADRESAISERKRETLERWERLSVEELEEELAQVRRRELPMELRILPSGKKKSKAQELELRNFHLKQSDLIGLIWRKKQQRDDEIERRSLQITADQLAARLPRDRRARAVSDCTAASSLDDMKLGVHALEAEVTEYEREYERKTAKWGAVAIAAAVVVTVAALALNTPFSSW